MKTLDQIRQEILALPPEERLDRAFRELNWAINDAHTARQGLEAQREKMRQHAQRMNEAEGKVRSLETRLAKAEEKPLPSPGPGPIRWILPSPTSPPGGSCPKTGKTRYTSEERAKKAMKGIRSGDRLRTYRCPHCRDIHLTSQARPYG